MSGLYYRCPSCRTVLADKQIPYEKGMQKICNDIKLSKKQKDAAKEKLLDDLFLDKNENMCCRGRMMTYMKQIEIIV